MNRGEQELPRMASAFPKLLRREGRATPDYLRRCCRTLTTTMCGWKTSAAFRNKLV